MRLLDLIKQQHAMRMLINRIRQQPALIEPNIRAAQVGINAPMIPGIMPIVNVAQLRNFAQRCGLTIPREFDQQLDGLDEVPERRDQFALDFALTLCRRLHAEGVKHFHIYTLNRATLPRALGAALGA